MKRIVSFITENFEKEVLESFEISSGLLRASNMTEDEIIEEISLSGLKGRGGAAYPTGKKLAQSAVFKSDVKYLICNADEGEPGTFKDRDLLKYDALGVFEGMVISALAVRATDGILYLREEYSFLIDELENILSQMRSKKILGHNILDTGLNFDISIFSGAGAYICGEGTSLIESIEGKPGRPRNKPPYTKEQGLFMKPTLLNNVETYAAINAIMKNGYEEFIKYGTEKSPGTKLISLCGNVNSPGTYEIPFGVTLKEIIEKIGNGVKNERNVKFVQIGGISGPLILGKNLDIPFTYEDFDKIDVSMGSGAILVVDDQTDILDFLDAVQAFFKHESCGKCTPCREGNRQLLNVLARMRKGIETESDIVNIERIAKTMKYASFCGLGQTAPTALLSAIKNCPEEIFRRGEQHA
ncbi:MAG: SLBB domain-containing protein [Clostridiales bacterium]|nr:SLBB domain-containing protein [Clostridiales bacterium]